MVGNLEIYDTRGNILYIDGVSCVELAQTYDTPLYVLSENKIRKQYGIINSTLAKNFDRYRILYSAKANTSLSVLKIMKTLGAGIDAVSIGEVYLSLEAGFKPKDILFTATMVRDDELKFIVDNDIPINVDSISELKRLLNFYTPEFLSIRVNPEFGAGHHEHVITAGKRAKFGIWDRDAIKAYKIAKNAGVKEFGIQMHIGSGILDIDPYLLATRKLLQIIKEISNQTNIEFTTIDIGGGYGVPYRPSDKKLPMIELFEQLAELYNRGLEKYTTVKPIFTIEPGRFLVCEAGVLLTRVNTVELKSDVSFVGIDAGFNTLIRPAMYGSYHHILVATKMREKNTQKYTIAGPLCESGDILAKDRLLPKVEEGDLIAILNAGAYGFTMSSHYNSKPKASEVLIYKENHELIRLRENLQSLKTGQKYASWLQ